MITKSEQFKKDKFFWVLLGVFVLIIIAFLIVSNWKIKERRAYLNSQIETLTQEIEELKKEKKQLEASVIKNKEEFLEEVARNQLNLKKPGEEVVVVKKEFEEKEEVKPKRSWWQRILDYLFR